jgi:hypothetical protein
MMPLAIRSLSVAMEEYKAGRLSAEDLRCVLAGTREGLMFLPYENDSEQAKAIGMVLAIDDYLSKVVA